MTDAAPRDRSRSRLVPTSLAAAALLVGGLVGGAGQAAAATPAAAPGAADTAAAELRTDRMLELQRRLQTTRSAHDRALQRLQLLRRHSADRAADAETAGARSSELAAGVDTESPGLLNAVGDWATGDNSLDLAEEAMVEAAHLQELAAIARDGLAAAQREVRRTARRFAAARTEAALVEQATAADASARLALEWARLPEGYAASTDAQDRRNRAALRQWRESVVATGRAGLVPPTADRLEGTTLPDGVRPLVDDTGTRVHGVGVARGRDGVVEVLPDVAVRAVSAAFASLGTSAEGTSTDGPACTDLVQRVWDVAQVDVPADGVELWGSLTAVPERRLVPGDVVFFEVGERQRVGHGAGIAVDATSVIALDPASGEVGVRRVAAAELLGVRRATLAAEYGVRQAAVPAAVEAGCAPPAPEPEPVDPAMVDLAAREILAGGDGLLVPVVGSWSMSAPFGASGSLWSSGTHTGQDFSAPTGTPVVAAAAGTVTVEREAWAGELVRVDHGGGLETWYAHMSEVDVATGDSVAAGARLGAVGSEGNSTGPHLHFEVRVDGTPVDPRPHLPGNGS